MPDQVEEFFARLGLRPGAVERLTLGRGVLANTAIGLASIMVPAGFVGWALHDAPYLAALIIILAMALCVWYLQWTTRTTDKHPLSSILGGADLVRYHEIEMGAKDLTILPESPNKEPPTSIGGSEV